LKDPICLDPVIIERGDQSMPAGPIGVGTGNYGGSFKKNWRFALACVVVIGIVLYLLGRF
jgi:hypothetical protein